MTWRPSSSHAPVSRWETRSSWSRVRTTRRAQRSTCCGGRSPPSSISRAPRTSTGWLWITEFPLFEKDHETGAVFPAQHAFTMPGGPGRRPDSGRPDVRHRAGLRHRLQRDGVRQRAACAATIPTSSGRSWRATGLSAEEIEARFGFLLEAFRYGVPPHGGVAVGTRSIGGGDGADALDARRDRVSRRRAAARGLMEGSPSEVTPEELAELGISIDPQG